MLRRTRPNVLATIACSVLMSACGGGGQLLTQTGSIAGLPTSVPMDPLEVYRLVARAAAQCWFGPAGRLSDRYIFHASAPSPAEGGAIEIAIHNRMPDPKKPWGSRALVIELSGTTSTNLAFRNISMPASEMTSIRTEVLAWANNRSLCNPVPAGGSAAGPGPATSGARQAGN